MAYIQSLSGEEIGRCELGRARNARRVTKRVFMEAQSYGGFVHVRYDGMRT